MKPYLLTTGTIFGLGGASHVFALVRGWRLLSSDLGFVVENALLGAIGLGLAVWAFRLTKVTVAHRVAAGVLEGVAGCTLPRAMAVRMLGCSQHVCTVRE